MKYVALAFMFPALAMAETYITYDDGSVYTLGDYEAIFVSEDDLYAKRETARGNVNFEIQDPFSGRDYVEPEPTPSDPFERGSFAWCEAFVDTGYVTFDRILWKKACDTNDDGKFGCGDRYFEGTEEGKVCAGES